MKVVLLAGGLGTRLAEETVARPKPMVEIGGHPILWHIMKNYSAFGFSDFLIALGYKGGVIKEYFLNYHAMRSEISVALKSGEVEYSKNESEDWRVRLVDTGLHTMTGGRLKRLEQGLRADGTFMLSYGDGVCDVDIAKLLAYHRAHGKKATVTAVRPTARFGAMQFDGQRVSEFLEKPQAGEGWVNGGFFVFEPEVFDYISDDTTVLERGPLERLAAEGQLMAFKHQGFWQCMDTLRDKTYLEDLWDSGNPLWKIWQ